MTWATPRTWTPGEVVTSANMNIHVRDQFLHLQDATPISAVLGADYTLTTSFADPGSVNQVVAVNGWIGVSATVYWSFDGNASDYSAIFEARLDVSGVQESDEIKHSIHDTDGTAYTLTQSKFWAVQVSAQPKTFTLQVRLDTSPTGTQKALQTHTKISLWLLNPAL